MNGIAGYPKVKARARGAGSVSGAGTLLLSEMARVLRLVEGLSVELAGFARPRSVHDPGKIVCDLAVMLAAGGDCPADLVMLRSRPQVFGPVASDPTVSRLMDALAGDVEAALAAIRFARRQARMTAEALAGPGAGREPLVVDVDATLVTAHSEKEHAAPTYKRGFGFHPLLAWADHGPGGTGAPLAGLLRPGNANAGTAADHVQILDEALAQLDPGDATRVLVRSDTAGCTHAFLARVADLGLDYSVGFYARSDVAAAVAAVEASAWVPAVDADDQPRDGAWVAELTGSLDLTGWPSGLRVIARKERPHPGAQLRLTDVDGHRITCFATNTTGQDLPALELRHRRRARVEDRIRAAKDTGLRNLPYADFASNQVWVEIVLLACDLLTWTQTLALDGPWRAAEPKTLRLRLFTTAARLITTGRRRILDLDPDWPWAAVVHHGLQRLAWLATLTPA